LKLFTDRGRKSFGKFVVTSGIYSAMSPHTWL